MNDKPNFKGDYGSTEHFYVIDSIGVPHPYCIGPRHVGHASDNFYGRLGSDAIRSAENAGIMCDICRKSQQLLSFDEHEQALLIGCLAPIKDSDGKANKELHGYLLSIKDEAERNGYVGFSFLDRRDK